MRAGAKPAAGAKLKSDGSLDAGSFKNEMPPMEFELGEKSPSSTCNFTRKSRHWHASDHVFCDGRVSKIVVTMAFGEADSRHAGELSVCFVFREKANSTLSHIGQKVQSTIKSDTATLEFEVSFCTRFFGTGDPLLPIGQTLGRLWGRLWGSLWGGFAEAWGSFWSLRINLRRLWETLGDSGGAFGEALGGFGELWETLGESLGSLWEALGKLWEPFRGFLLLAPSLPPLYI